VGLHGRESPAPVVANVRGDPLAAQQQLHAVLGESGLQGLADQRVGRAVAVTIDLDVIVNVDL